VKDKSGNEKLSRLAGGRVAIDQDHFAGLKTLAKMCENGLKSGYLPRNMGCF
jgi:hypothetical protein